MATRDLVLIALFAAMTAALAIFPPITLPVLGVPITAQTLGVMLAGCILGARRGGLAILLFIVLVAFGVPLLAGGRGGFGVLLGPSGGFLLAWPLTAFFIGLTVEHLWSRFGSDAKLPIFWSALGANILFGIGFMFACGVLWLTLVAGLPFDKAFSGTLLFVPGDIIKGIIAAFVATVVRLHYPIIAPARS